MIIDVHTHIGWVNAGASELTVDALLRWMDKNHIDRAVLLPLESPEASYQYVTTTACLAAAKAHPDRFIPFAVRDPRCGIGMEQFLTMAVSEGAQGYGEVKNGLAFDDPRLLEQFELCVQYRWPVLLHLDRIRCLDGPGLPRLEKVVKRFPELTFIGHAPGWWCHISADVDDENYGRYNTGPVVPGGVLDRLLSTYPNLYADISAGSGFRALTRDPEFSRGFFERHRDKILFGTDKLAPEIEPRTLELPEILGLSTDLWHQVTDVNPRRVLGLLEKGEAQAG